LKKLIKWLIKLLLELIKALEKNVKESTPKTPQKVKMPTKKNTEVKGVSLLLIRDIFTDTSTIGKLFLNGESFCNTLELPWKENKRSISCIPSGEYKARIRLPRESSSRDYVHLLVQDVKDRSYILVHIGNRAEDTRGCILVGQTVKQDFVGNSTLAMELLIKEIINLGGTNINLIIKNK
tara:strand:+ start:118 stop:657 length:540 start_codon:yes stop_codon:yes gene_type:complete